MNSGTYLPGVIWIKNEWKLKNNPFPSIGMLQMGARDARENGLLYEPDVHAEQLREVINKFVIGMSYSGLKFGYLWSSGIIPGDTDARGFGKSVLMQHLAQKINKDFGFEVYKSIGLDDEDAAEVPICCVLTSFDTVHVRSLGAALFAAVEYAVTYPTGKEETLLSLLRKRLVNRAGSDDVRDLVKVVTDEHRALSGRTLGPPDDKLIVALCEGDSDAAADYLRKITPTSRSRNGAVYMATFLLFVAAAGVERVMVFCDQLEDLASTTTAKAKRSLEIERFRDVIVETLPMADMVTMVVTMHPRASVTIGTAWALADLPTFELNETNRHSTVRMMALSDANQAARLLRRYLVEAAKEGVEREEGDELFPFTMEAISCLFDRTTRKPRDVLRKAHKVFESAAEENLKKIEADDVRRFFSSADSYPFAGKGGEVPSNVIDWSQE
ncbi:hypothetical protein [Streptomyces termitum]|uniref:hypothetical protein n=1 Tax=Streptomyces termitum TaxID=67368 RepID=UPI00378BEE29